jgi:hypothetical protein
VAFSLGTSWCSATACNFSQLTSNFPTQASVPFSLDGSPSWPSSFHDGQLSFL